MFRIFSRSCSFLAAVSFFAVIGTLLLAFKRFMVRLSSLTYAAKASLILADCGDRAFSSPFLRFCGFGICRELIISLLYGDVCIICYVTGWMFDFERTMYSSSSSLAAFGLSKRARGPYIILLRNRLSGEFSVSSSLIFSSSNSTKSLI